MLSIKHVRYVVTITCLFCTPLYPMKDPEQWITVINDLGISTPVTVTISQPNVSTETISHDIVRKSSNKLYYFPISGEVIITAQASIKGKTVTVSKEVYPNVFNKNEVHIQKEEKNGIKIALLPKTQKKITSVVPKKQKVPTSKANDTDRYWTVLITDENDKKISQSTFKKDTTGFASTLQVQLSKTLFPYRHNKIKVFKKRGTTGAADIERVIIPDNITSGSKLEITADTIFAIGSDNNKQVLSATVAYVSEQVEEHPMTYHTGTFMREQAEEAEGWVPL